MTNNPAWTELAKRKAEQILQNQQPTPPTQPSYTPQVKINLPKWHPAMREFTAPPIQGKPYWTPRRIGRYYNAIKALPVDGVNLPEWVDVPKINAAYQYLTETRQSDWQTWDDDLDNDPVLQEFVSSLPVPALDAIPDWEQKDLEQGYQPDVAQPVGEWTKYGIDYATWQGLPEWKRWANRLFRSRAGRDIMGGAQFAAPFFAAGQPILGGLSFVGGVGVSELAQREAERAAMMGSAYKPGIAYYLLGAFNFAYSQSQQILGLAAQTFASIKDPEKYGSLSEIFGDWESFKAAYESGEAFWLLLAYEQQAKEAREREQGKTYDWLGLNKAMLEASERGEYELSPEQKKIVQELEQHKGEIRSVNLAGEDVFIPVPKDRSLLSTELTEMRRMLRKGEIRSEQVLQYFSEKYGFGSEITDLVAGLVADPLNFMPNIEVPAIRKIAQMTGHENLARAFTDVPDVLEGIWKYRQIVRTELTPNDVAKLSNISKWIAGVTPEGRDKLLQSSANGKIGFVDKMFGLTPEARAIEIQHQFIQGLSMLLETERGNPDGIMRLLNTLSQMNPEDSVGAIQEGKIKITVGGKVVETDLPRWFVSVEGQSVPLMMKDLMPAVRDHYDMWKATRPQAELLRNLADGLDTDVYRLISDIANDVTNYDQIMASLRELDAQGNAKASALLKQLSEMKDLSNASLKKSAKLFAGKDAFAFDADLWTVQLWNILAEGADKWAVKFFGIKPSGWAQRLAHVVKQAGSLLLLGLNPAYLANNAVNNVVTMAWDGLLGTMSKKERLAYMNRFGMTTKIHKAFNQAEIGTPVGERIEILGAKEKGYDVGQKVRQSKRANDALQMASDLLHKSSKFAYAAVLSGKVEAWASEMATVRGIMEYMDRVWRPGVGFDKMPEELRIALEAVQPGLAERIENAIARGLNKEEIEREVFSNYVNPALKDVLTPDEMAMLDHFPGLVNEIDNGLRDAKTPEDIYRVFDNAITRIKNEIVAESQRKINVITQRAAVKVQTEGAKGAFDIMDQIVPERHDFWMQHLQKMDEVATEAMKLTGLERANLWREELEKADRDWRLFQNLEGAKWLGIVEGFGYDKMTPEYAQMAQYLWDVHDAWGHFYETRRQLMDEYWAFIENTDFSTMSKGEAEALRSQKWHEINEKLNELYAQIVSIEDAYQQDMDALLWRIAGDEKVKAEIETWRKQQLIIRRQMIAAMILYRLGKIPDELADIAKVLPKDIVQKILLLNNGEPIYRIPFNERDKINQKFYRQIYQPLVASMMKAEKKRKGVTQPPEAQPPVEVKTIKESRAVEALINKIMAKEKPDIQQVLEGGAPNPDYKLSVIKWLRKWSPTARERNIKRWEDLSVPMIIEALDHERNFDKAQARLDDEMRADETLEQGGIPLMITQSMKQQLEGLGYTADEIKEMTPKRAWEILRASKQKETKAQLSKRGEWLTVIGYGKGHTRAEENFYGSMIFPSDYARDTILRTAERLLKELPEETRRYVTPEGEMKRQRGFGGEWYWNEYDRLAEELRQAQADRKVLSSELKRADPDLRKKKLKLMDDLIRDLKNRLGRFRSDYENALQWLIDSIKLGRIRDYSDQRINEFRYELMRRVLDEALNYRPEEIPSSLPIDSVNPRMMFEFGYLDDLVDLLDRSNAFNEWEMSDYESRGLTAHQVDTLVNLWLEKKSKEEGGADQVLYRRVPEDEHATKRFVLSKAAEMRKVANEMLTLAPPKEVNAQLFHEWLYNVYSQRYGDRPEIAVERAETTFAVIDRIVTNLARESGISKDQYYANFVLQYGSAGIAGRAGLFRPDNTRIEIEQARKLYKAIGGIDRELIDAAINYFGLTTDGREAGYILPDGKMLDFSGKKEGGMPHERSRDHSEIAFAFDAINREPPDFAKGVFAAQTGSLRITYLGYQLYVDIYAPLTEAQIRRLYNMPTENITWDITDLNGNTVAMGNIADPTLREIQALAGYANAIFNGEGDVEMPSVLFRSVPESWYYSTLERVIEKKVPEKATPEQVMGAIKGLVKEDEIEWTGLRGFLEGKKTVTKQELLDFVRDNQVKVKTIDVYDNRWEINFNEAIRKTRETADDVYRKFISGEDIDVEYYPILLELLEFIEDDTNILLNIRKYEIHDAYRETIKFLRDYYRRNIKKPDYVEDLRKTFLEYVSPNLSGEKLKRAFNYIAYNRELHEKYAPDNFEEYRIAEIRGTESSTKYGKYTEAGGENYREILFTLEDIDAEYKSPHFPFQNVVAHVRTKDRYTPDGKKILFIEEVQSDWHEQGRDRGYSSNISEIIREKYEWKIEDYDQSHDNLIVFEKTKYGLEKVGEVTIPHGDDPIKHIAQLINPVPDAPFKKTWDQLAMKQVIRIAVNEGYDGIAWTTGEMQARRYHGDLSGNMFAVVWKDESNGALYIKPKDTGYYIYNREVKRYELRRIFGKDGAEMLLDSDFQEINISPINRNETLEAQVISGDDILIAPNAMKVFYEQKLVNIANDLVKKRGGKPVEELDVVFGGEDDVRSVPGFLITKDLRENVLNERFPLFRSKEEWLNAIDRFEFERGDDWIYYNIIMKEEQNITNTVSIEDARILLGDAMVDKILESGQKTGIYRGDDLKDLEGGGFIIYPEDNVGGATWWLANGRAVIHAFRRADVADVLHEFVHAITPLLSDKDKATIRAWYEEEYQTKLPDTWWEKGRFHRDAMEKLARAFERYMTEGATAVTATLQAVFEKIKKWMLQIYKDITHKDIDIKINDAVREMFDRWLADPENQGVSEDVKPMDVPDMWRHKAQSGSPTLYRPLEGANGESPEAPGVSESPIGTGDELGGIPLEEITMRGVMNEVIPTLEKARRQIMGNKIKDVGAPVMPEEVDKELRKYLAKVYTQLSDAKIGAAKWGETRRSHALLDYSKNIGMDNYFTWLPYQFWYTRSALNWLLRVLNKPAILSNYYRLMRIQQNHTEGEGFPQRLKDKMFVPIPFMPDWMGGGVWVDPYRQLFPINQLAAPFRQAEEELNRENRRTVQILMDWADEGVEDPEAVSQAIQTRSGYLWAKARAKALEEVEQDFQNPFDYVFALTAPLLPISWAYNIMTGRADRIGQTPLTRFIQTMTSMAGIGGPRGINIEAPIRRGLGLPEIDRFEDYRVDRELASMTAEGLITPEQAKQAMIDRSGTVFEEAQRRVSQQGAIKYFGSFVAADLMPEGEARQRGLQEEFSKAFDAKMNGDPKALTKFFDKYPEYEVRMMTWKKPEERLRSYLISTIWDKYLALPKAQAKIFREEIGDDFNDLFLNKETRSYNSISTDTLAMWARTLTEDLPKSVGGAKADVDWLPDETAKLIQDYYDQAEKFGEYDPENPNPEFSKWQNKYLADHPAIIPYVIGEKNSLYGLPLEIQAYVYRYRAMRDERYPNLFEVQNKYFSLPTREQRRAYLASHPELKDYWEWRRQMAAQFPKAAPWILSDETLSAEILDEDIVSSSYSGMGRSSYSQGGGGSQGGSNYHPPYLTSSELKMFSQGLIMQLMALIYRGERLMPGGLAELTRIWEQLGKPYGTLDEFIEHVVKPTLEGVR